eukprot:TRINITY_DN54460_c0_g1_i1.p1 TRINITY_DN54460_c0_g1~~TRINITY_DN54460_c0_g1_i1.p1  ORF type:complete len:829 (-),score=166.50 TRINITY_DN54460_c0_g1_i1:183-2669(-)
MGTEGINAVNAAELQRYVDGVEASVYGSAKSEAANADGVGHGCLAGDVAAGGEPVGLASTPRAGVVTAFAAVDGFGDVMCYPAEAETESRIEVEPQLEFAVGETVSYWSETHGQWMEAKVEAYCHDRDGAIVYDLDVKKGAQPSKMRKLGTVEKAYEPPPIADASAVGFHEDEVSIRLGASICVSANGGHDEVVRPVYAVGERVEYWSETYKQWMKTTVMSVRDGGRSYDLEVKKNANRRRLRRIDADEEMNASVLTTDGRAAASAPPAAAAAAAAALANRHDAASCGAEYLAPSTQAPNLHGPGSVWPSVPATMMAAPLPAVAAGHLVGGSDIRALRSVSPLSGRPGCSVAQAAVVDGEGYVASALGAPRAQVPLGSAPASSAASSASVGPPAAPTTTTVTPAGVLALPAAAFASGGTSAVTPAGGSAHGGTVSTQMGGSASVAAADVLRQRGGHGGSPSRHGYGGATPTPTNIGGYAGQQQQQAVSRLAAAVQGLSSQRMPAAASASQAPSAVMPNGGSASSGSKITVKINGKVVNGPTVPVASGSTSLNARQVYPQMAEAVAGMLRQPASCSSQTTGGSGPAIDTGELHMSDNRFDASNPALHAQLISQLGLRNDAVIEEMKGFKGGLNEGIWLVNDGAAGLVLKLVRCTRIASGVPTEAENLAKLLREHPSIAQDSMLSFPKKILSCIGVDGTKRHDLIVMRKVPGDRLAEVIAIKYHAKQVPKLMQIFEKLGAALAQYHARYNNQNHGDFQPSNVFYCEQKDCISMIDIGGMGVPTTDNDVEHFTKSLKLLSEAYGARFCSDGMRHFDRGYSQAQGRARPPGR